MNNSIKVAFFLALKSIYKGNQGVNILTILMLGLVYMNLQFVPGLIEGLVTTANEKLIRTYTGDIYIEAQGENNLSIKHSGELVDIIEAMPGVVAASAINRIGAQIRFKDDRVGTYITGVDPAQEKKTLEVYKYMIEGTYLEPRDMDQIILGIQLAGSDRTNLEYYASSLQHVHAGDKVTVKYDINLEKEYKVKGIFYAEFLQSDIQAYISDRELLTVIPTARNTASAIRVKLEDGIDPEWLISQISSFRKDLKFQTWVDRAGLVRSMTDSFDIIKRILWIVNLLVAGITIFIVIYVDVINRRRQIGIQRAIGITPQSITTSYLFRTLFYVAMGMLIGGLIFNFVVVPLEARYPLHFPIGSAYIHVDIAYKIAMAVTLLAVSMVSAIIPVLRTIKINLIDAIWG
jgi:putative ABC transport system permease protein